MKTNVLSTSFTHYEKPDTPRGYNNIALQLQHSCFVTFDMITLLNWSVWQPSRWSALVFSLYSALPNKHNGTLIICLYNKAKGNTVIMDIHNWIIDISFLQYGYP